MPQIFWALLASTLAAWLAMNLVTVPRIEALAGNLRLLDMRFTGYSFVEAQDFIKAIGEEGAAQYLGTQFWLDMVFPPLLGAVLIISYRGLFSGLLWIAASAGSLAYVVIDVLENIAIATMLHAGADSLTQEMVATANQWTTTKWSLALIGLMMLLIGIASCIRRRVVAA